MTEPTRQIQAALLALGYDPKGVDGIFGANTEAAAKAWMAAGGKPFAETGANYANPIPAPAGPLVNAATLALIKEFEGLRLTAYQDSVGVWTIGYGTTAAAGVGIAPKAGMTITQTEAEEYLRRGLEKFGAHIRPLIKAPVSDNEFGACLSLAYNIGPGAFAGSSVLRYLNQSDRLRASAAFAAWNKAGGVVLPGLTRRRAAEAELFLTA